MQARQGVWPGNRWTAQQDDLGHLEHGEVEADAERQNQNRGDRKDRRALQRSHAETKILRCIVEPVPSPRVARVFEQAVRVAELRGIRHRLSMLVHLAHELALMTGSIEQVPDAAEPGAHVDSRMAAMASAM